MMIGWQLHLLGMGMAFFKISLFTYKDEMHPLSTKTVMGNVTT